MVNDKCFSGEVATHFLLPTDPLVSGHFLPSASTKNIDETEGDDCCGNAHPDFGVMLSEDNCGLIAEFDSQPALKPKSNKAAESQREQEPPDFHAKDTGSQQEDFEGERGG